MKIEDLRKLCNDDNIQITDHAFRRCRERNISLDEITDCINQGEIIESYPDDYPFPSALIFGIVLKKPLHIVAGLSETDIWIISAYHPDPEKWNDDFKTRKEN